MQLRARKSTNTFCPHCRKTLWKHTFSHHARCVCVDSFVYSSDSLSRFLECASAFPPTGPPIHLPQLHAGFCCFKSFKNPPGATDGQAQRRLCAQLYWIYTYIYVAVRLERFSQHFGEKLQHLTSARLGFSLSEKSRNYANGEWWGVISLWPQEGDARIPLNGLAWPGSAPLGSALPHKELPKVGVWCRRDHMFSKKLAFGVDETTLDF
jgi:hypothetical protein